MAEQTRDPTRREIRAACGKIRAKWTDEERQQRGSSLTQKDKRRTLNIKVIDTSDLPESVRRLISRCDYYYMEEWDGDG